MILVILLPKGSICCTDKLEMSADSPTVAALNKRENYEKITLVMFLQSCCTYDLKSKTDNTHWTKVVDSIQDGIFNEIELEVLHNIEERETAQKMKSATKPLT